ncbi:EF-hand calcium-binding domain-containing protein 12 [Chanos chanos]|uniref:EF-hand calcium-binding domain-containing protein 12 n=1 Tax=Chanos chanos TaxID=29144 RepID=A0A6J2VLU4_CHACN|nr:EF-hand calcium-binding domain-containing protein 12 [Chanos chanos]
MMGGHGFMTRNNVRALGEGEEGGKEAGEEEAALRRTHREMPVFSSRRAILRGPKVMTSSTCHTEVKHQCGPTHEEYGYPTRKRRQVWTRRADPNAFWPGREEHVRLYLPQVGFSPGGVLFQCIQHTPAPSPGNWPVSPQGYSTSGDIDGHKVYTL